MVRICKQVLDRAFNSCWFTSDVDFKTYALSPQQDEMILVIESVLSLIWNLKRSTSPADVVIHFGSFYRSVTGKSVVGSVVVLFETLGKSLSGYVTRAQSSLWIDTLDDFHKNLHRVRDSVLGKKIIEVLNHVVAHTFYHKMGIEVDSKLFHQIEKGYLKTTWLNAVSFADAIIGLVLFLAKAGRQALLTGSAQPFFVDSSTTSDWLLEAGQLKKDSEFLGNPEAVGLKVPMYLKRLEDAIEVGGHLRKALPTQRALVDGVILELQTLLRRHQSTLAASSFRFCPFGVFVYGSSGVGKSFISKGLFHHYCAVAGYDKDKAVLYPRNPEDKYYSGFKSSMVGIVFDDVAKHKSAKVLGIDQSLGDLISVGNNIPMITNQADAPDKGKIPLLCEWMGVTSNIENLSVEQYYLNTYAVLRRLPYRIEPIVKEEYRKPGKLDLDPTKVPPGQYPDCWTFEVCSVVKVEDGTGLNGRYQQRGKGRMFESYAKLLEWMTGEYQAHIDNQRRLLKTVSSMGPEKLCTCRVPVSVCVCDQEEPIRIPEVEGDVAQTQLKCEDSIRILFEQKRLILAEDLAPGLETMFREDWLKTDFQVFLSKVASQQECDVENIHSRFQQSLLRFRESTPSQQAESVSFRGFESQDQDHYLTFIPVKGGKRGFIRSHMRLVKDAIRPYTQPLKWDKYQEAAFEVYINEHLPRHISEGWDDPSIYRAALDYVRFHAKDFKPPEEFVTAVLDAEEADDFTFPQRVCQWMGMQYVSRPWIFHGVNYITSFRFVQCAVAYLFDVPQWRVSTLHAAAAFYDFRLKGAHRFVVVIIAMCSVATLVGLWKMVSSRLFSDTDSQVSVHKMGRKPLVRKEEKENVWTVEERSLTNLDFHPSKPNNLQQLHGMLSRNVKRATFRAQGLRGETSILVVNQEMFVINSHALYLPMTLTVHLGASREQGTNPTWDIEIEESMVTILKDRDIAIVRTWGMPSFFKNIRHCFPKRTFDFVGACEYYIVRQKEALCEPVVGAICTQGAPIDLGNNVVLRSMRYEGRVRTNTQYGDCGSPLVMTTPRGPVIVGIHSALTPARGITHATQIFWEDLEERTQMSEVGVVAPSVPVAQTDLVDLPRDAKLYTEFHKSGQIVSMGRLEGFRPRFKATGDFTSVAGHFLSHPIGQELGIVHRLYQPVMSGWLPQQNILKEYLRPTHSMRESTVRICAASFVAHICGGLTPEDVEDIHPVPLDVAVNGFPGVPNVDAQKFCTAAGHGLPGPKKTYVDFDGPFEEWARCRKYDAQVEERVQRIIDLAQNGVRSHPIFTAHLKDEMVSERKVLACKTRGFYICPVDYLTAMRMYSMGLCRVMVRRRSLFRIAVGLNTHSEQWHELFLESEEIPGENWLAGDFVGFDKILSILIQNAAREVILGIAEHCGWDKQDLLALRTLLDDTITPAVDFFGELVVFLGGEVSGHQLTTFFNCICNVGLHHYAWVELAEKHGLSRAEAAPLFWKNVFICVLGDDIIAKVHPDYFWYNHTTVQEVFAGIGIEYTMADKTSASRAYIPLDEVTFLKRRFRRHSHLEGITVAPLERESIYKMLLYTIPSRSVSPEEQLAQAIGAAMSEAFYHGEDFYNQLETLVTSAPFDEEQQARLAQFPYPSYAQCFDRFVQSSPNYRVLHDVPSIEAETSPSHVSICEEFETIAQAFSSVRHRKKTTMGRSPEEAFQSGVRLSSKEQSRLSQIEKTVTSEFVFLSKNTKKNQPTMTEGAIGDMASAPIEKAINKLTSKDTRKVKKLRWKNKSVAQSALTPLPYTSFSEWVECVAGRCPMSCSYCRPIPQALVRPDTTGNVSLSQELTTFQAEPEHDTVDLTTRPNEAAENQTIASSLARYMSRPELVYSLNVTEAMTIGTVGTVAIWEKAMTPSKREKLSGFGLFRGNLCVKFVVNGSPFLYVGLMAAYTPLSGYRGDTVSTNAPLSLLQQSQKPHTWLNVQNTSTAMMKLPFLFPYPHMNTNQLSNFTKLGKLDFVMYAPLQSANGVTGTSVDVQVYTWFEDVDLSGPTNLPVAQSSVEYDNDHQISGAASAVASVAGALSAVPIIGPYALATSEAATMAATVAGALGYTNVPNVSDVAPMKQRPFNMASTDISEPVEKLSLSAKQETTVDASHYGSPSEDELTVQKFCSRESFLIWTDWTTSNVPADSLFTWGVSPLAHQLGSGVETVMTPMCFASTGFQWWRGSIKVTLKAIRSKYHRGRVQLSWDRSSGSLANGPALGNPNTLSTVLDLDEGDEVSMTIPYQQQQLFLPTVTPFSPSTGVPVTWSISTSPPATSSNAWNGVVNVRVLTRLTSPEASSNVRFLIFVSAGDDFELAGPTVPDMINAGFAAGFNNSSLTIAQSAVQYEERAPEMENNNVSEPYDKVYYDVFGEKCASLRQLMHRSARAITVCYNLSQVASAQMRYYTVPLKRLPPAPGFWNNGFSTVGTSPVQYINFAHWHPLTWFTPCFVGYKGSTNVTANLINTTATGNGFADHMSIKRASKYGQTSSSARRPFTGGFTVGTVRTNADSFHAQQSLLLDKENGYSGMALTNTRTNTGLSANLPYYSPSAFFLSDMGGNYSNTETLSGANEDWWLLTTKQVIDSNSLSFPEFEIYYASGPDFNVFFFINTPTVYHFAYSAP